MARFNPAPGWPPPPAGWSPPPGWLPDPAWPPAPDGWPLMVEDAEPAAPRTPEDDFWLDDATRRLPAVDRPAPAPGAAPVPPAAPAPPPPPAAPEPDFAPWQATAPGPQDFSPPPAPPAPPGAPWPGQPWPAQQHQDHEHSPPPGFPPGQQHPGQQYPGQQYPGQQYPGQQYPGQQYPGQQSPGQSYAPGSAVSGLPPWLTSIGSVPVPGKVAVGAGALVVLSSLVPWRSRLRLSGVPAGYVPDYLVNPSARALAFLIGAVLISGVFAWQLPQWRARAILAGLVASGVGILLCLGIAVRGWIGETANTFAFTLKATWNPAPGLWLCFAGVVAAAIAYAMLANQPARDQAAGPGNQP